jgi:hypothetical protein
MWLCDCSLCVQAMEQGNMEGARIFAESAIRDKNTALNYLRLSSRIDAVAQRVNTAVKMQTLTKDMSGIVKRSARSTCEQANGTHVAALHSFSFLLSDLLVCQHGFGDEDHGYREDSVYAQLCHVHTLLVHARRVSSSSSADVRVCALCACTWLRAAVMDKFEQQFEVSARMSRPAAAWLCCESLAHSIVRTILFGSVSLSLFSRTST